MIKHLNNSRPLTPMKPPPRQQFGRLAMLYYPDRSYKRAVHLFREEIRITGGLLNALKRVGYDEHQRLLTRRQVKVIERFLGEAG